MNREFYINNRKKLIEQLKDNSLVVLFSGRLIRKTADDFYSFFANRNFLYVTGLEMENFQYIASKENGLIKEWLFIEEPNESKEIRTGRKMRINEAAQISGIDEILYNDSFKNRLLKLIQDGCFNNIYLDLDMFITELPKTYEQHFGNYIKSDYPHMRVLNTFPIFKCMRTFKTEEEIRRLRDAISLTKEGIDAMMSICKPGMKEYELEAEFKYVLAKSGCRYPGFKPIISSGANNFYLHYNKPYDTINDGELVLCDVGASVDGYCADISRVFPANGKFTDRQKVIYEAAYAGLKAAQKIGKPGCTFEKFEEITREVSGEFLRELGLVKKTEDIKKYMIHGVAHHIGLDVHDIGIYDIPMAENMVFTLDVGIYVRQWNVGLRIEDNVLVTKTGIENLSDTVGIVKEIEAIQGKILN